MFWPIGLLKGKLARRRRLLKSGMPFPIGTHVGSSRGCDDCINPDKIKIFIFFLSNINSGKCSTKVKTQYILLCQEVKP